MNQYFHPHLVLYSSMRVDPENTVTKKSDQNKTRKALPSNPPINGGINSTIPLLGGMSLLRQGG
ncbi:MAG: hypothetical protein GX432_04755 [Candidatus Atribacteria bacterium]|nr:hypothetical protein [Candidatus Atribacteria bacterium]